MTDFSKYSDNDLVALNKKLTAQIVAVNCEIQKRDAIRKMKHSLQGELEKINASSMEEIKHLSSTTLPAPKQPRSKKSTKPKEAAKDTSKADGDKYKAWTVKKMQNFLDSKRVEYKKSLSRDELIKTIQGKSLVREMNSYA